MPAAPLPLSKTIFNFFEVELLDTTSWMYWSSKLIFSIFASLVAHDSTSLTYLSISSPETGPPSSTIFNPLSSFGLWLPVIMTPWLVEPTFVA